jgi:hypothetical protein
METVVGKIMITVKKKAVFVEDGGTTRLSSNQDGDSSDYRGHSKMTIQTPKDSVLSSNPLRNMRHN